MKVDDILKVKGREVVTLRPDATIAEASKLMITKGIGAVVVTDEQARLQGLVSERDIVQGLSTHGVAVLSMQVGSLMRADVNTCKPGDTLLSAMGLMTDRRVRHLPVVVAEDGMLCGIISVGDAVKGRIDEIEAEAHALREYIAMA